MSSDAPNKDRPGNRYLPTNSSGSPSDLSPQPDSANPPHSANVFPRTVVVHYRFHPLVGRTLIAVRSHGPEVVVCEVEGQGERRIPTWMLDETVCACAASVGRPQTTVDALARLRDLLMPLCSEGKRQSAGGEEHAESDSSGLRSAQDEPGTSSSPRGTTPAADAMGGRS